MSLRGIAPVLLMFQTLAAPAAHAAEKVAESGDQFLARREGVWVMKLSGTREEMARGHGEFIKDIWRETALPYFASKLRRSIEQTYIVKDIPALGGIAKWGVDALAIHPLIRRIPEADRKVLEAFADGAGIPLEDALTAYVVPDAGQWLLATLFGGQRITKGFIGGISPFGCTSFVTARGGAGSEWIHARNLDYDSFGIFDRNPVVIFFDPSEPGAQRYASFTSLGIHTAGITAVNESGIGLSLHQIMVDDVSTRGTSILSINDSVIRQARGIDEAIEILRASRFAGSWAVQISSEKERRAVSVEVSSGRFFVRENPKADLLMTNHVFGESLREREFAFSRSYPIDSRSRYSALETALSDLDVVTPQSAIDLISGTFHRLEPSALPGGPLLGTVAKGNNIQSIVMLPGSSMAYVAVPLREDAKPVDGAYVAIPLAFDALESNDAFFEALESAPRSLASSQPLPDASLEAQTLLRRASALATDHGQYGEARELLQKASRLQPQDAHYALLAALFAFREAGNRSDQEQTDLLDEAYVWLDVAASIKPAPYHDALIHLFRARYYDLLERREDAVGEYELASKTHFSDALTDAADEGLKRRYRSKGLRKIVLDALLGDVYRF